MGIESIGSIGRVASVAPSVGRIGPALGRVGGGIEGGFSISKISNPFKAAGSLSGFAENRGPSLLNPLGIEVIRNPFLSKTAPQLIPVSKVRILPGVLTAKEVKTIGYNQSRPRPVVTKAPEHSVIRWPEPARGLDVRVITNPFAIPKVEAAPQIMVQKSVESRATNAIARVTLTPTQSQIQTEQVVEEKKVVQEQKNEPEIKKRKKQSVLKIKFTEAVGISKNRIAALRRAYQEARAKGLSMKLLRAFLSPSYWEEKSPIAKQGYDWTLNLTVSELENQNNEFADETKANQAISFAVANHIPVEEGEGGRQATVEEVREVLEGRQKEILRSNTPAEMVIKRVVEKKVEVIKSGQVMESVLEWEEIKETDLKLNRPLDIY